MKAAAEADRGSGRSRRRRRRFAWKPACGGGTEADFRGSRRGVEAVRGIGVEAVSGDSELRGTGMEAETEGEKRTCGL